MPIHHIDHVGVVHDDMPAPIEPSSPGAPDVVAELAGGTPLYTC